jgi:tetratricopeptide (TPR) repeat protein/serine/threonine protein kinase
MSDVRRNPRAIFGEALDCASPSEQAAYLDRACGDDSALRGRVEALLRAHQRAGQFLQGPTAPPERSPATEAPGTVLGHYRLLEPLGEGGFGIVYRAEQQQPVRRRVALKVLKPEMAGTQVVARFEAERQALALMEHPNIARVLDAGEAPPAYAGGPPRPYFVMELVEGVPLTDFCDQQRLSPRERLGLFTSVCQAVQHAHQKGIIHRDLKPSNLLVTRVDGLPVVKVIDFGVAKALEQRLTDKTLVTAVAQVVGTPLYMSPEQAEPGGVDIDTRSDIYALGVLLYELLTGTTPFDRERLSKASFDEMRRIIREEEPPRPSARLSTLGQAALTLSEQRRTDPRQLGQLLRGELDWVVMKCLEKDRGRRYQTADALARDVARYLADEPVEACPPSAVYRLRKFLRKHRRPLFTVAVFLALLAAGGMLVGRQAVREARAQRDRAVEQAKRNEAIRDALDQVRTLREDARKEWDAGKWARAREQAQRALTLVESGPADEALAAQVRQVQEELDEEKRDRRLVADLEAARLAGAETLSGASRFAGERAIPRYRKAFRAYSLAVGEGDPAAVAARLHRRPPEVRQAVSAALDDWLSLAANRALGIDEPHLGWLRALAAAEPDGGGMQEMRAASQERDPVRRRAALERLAATADPRRWPAAMLTRLAQQLQFAGANGSAEQLLRRAWRQYPADFWVNERLGILLRATQPQRWPEAVRHLMAAVVLRPDSPGAHLNLGNALLDGGQVDEAIACYRHALDLDPKYASAHNNLGNALKARGKMDEAIGCLRKAIELDPNFTSAYSLLGSILGRKGQLDEAIACLRKAIALNSRHASTHADLGDALAVKGQLDEAIACYRKALELDPRYVVVHYRLGMVLGKKGQVDEAIACFRQAIQLDAKFARAHGSLGEALATKGEVDAAIACLRRAIELDPTDVEAHSFLGTMLEETGQPDAAIACFRRTLELDPKRAAAHVNLGKALAGIGQVDEAIAHYTKAIELDPKLPEAHANLGDALVGKGQVDKAIAHYTKASELDPKRARGQNYLGVVLALKGEVDKAIAHYNKAIELDPTYALARFNLGSAFFRKGRLDEAVACFRRTIELDPKLAEAHCRLGLALAYKGKADEAIAYFRQAIALAPKHATAHANLGAVLFNKGQLDAAITYFTKAIELDPKLAEAHAILGRALHRKGQLDEAIARYKKATQLKPNYTEIHDNLGIALQARGRLEEAIARYKKAIEVKPTYAEAYCNLGDALQQQGRFAESVAAYQRGHELGTKQPGWSSPSATWLRRARRIAAMEAKLPAFLKGEFQPSDSKERLGLAGVCRGKKLYHKAVGLYADAFAADPKLADDLTAEYRYNAACCAALAAAGQGEDAGKLDAGERARLRQRALDWLHADLALLGKQCDSGEPAARDTVHFQLLHWQQNSALAGIHDRSALDKLPAVEQKALAQLWSDVAALLAKTAPAPK